MVFDADDVSRDSRAPLTAILLIQNGGQRFRPPSALLEEMVGSVRHPVRRIQPLIIWIVNQRLDSASGRKGRSQSTADVTSVRAQRRWFRCPVILPSLDDGFQFRTVLHIRNSGFHGGFVSACRHCRCCRMPVLRRCFTAGQTRTRTIFHSGGCVCWKRLLVLLRRITESGITIDGRFDFFRKFRWCCGRFRR